MSGFRMKLTNRHLYLQLHIALMHMPGERRLIYELLDSAELHCDIFGILDILP